MKRIHVFTLSLLSAFALIILHLVAVSLRLYWTIWWVDVVFHFWGGVIVGSAAVSILMRRSDTIKRSASIVMSVVLSVAVLWEVKEFLNQTYYTNHYVLDTIADICMGLAGGLTAFLVAHRSLNSKRKLNNAN